MATNDGGPAFPHPGVGHASFPGMTLRDYFAGQALAGMAGSQESCGAAIKMAKAEGKRPMQVAALVAYEFADTMLKARDETTD